MKRCNSYTRKKSQRGLTLVLMTMSMMLLVGISALSIDVSHMVVNKTRLQNAVDTIALAGATIANRTFEASDTETVIVDAYNKILASPGNDEIKLEPSEDGSGFDLLDIEYSDTPNSGFSPTFPSTADRVYVRVQVSGVDLNEFFIQAFGLSKNVSASAVAGPVFVDGTTNILPIGMCEGDDLGPSGYEVGKVYEIKTGSQSDDPDGLGAGNFHLLDVGSGKSAVSDALVGKNTVVVSIDEEIDSESGNAVGATASIDSRFDGATIDGVYYPPDLITTEPSPEITTDNIEDHNDSTALDKWTYDEYVIDTNACLNDQDCISENGSAWRRVLPVPILDCDSASKSGGKIEFTVTSIGCFFMSQRYESSTYQGQSGHQSIFGEFIESCTVVDGGASDTDTGVSRIVLFKDPTSVGGGS
ncbi:TadE/TadG family type IV pilus assembly protein [Vibrio paucivorans]|uniref:Pilus assembly protein TadG-related protein n=1 Tax=Vibrio paucivorans TaxID=2829489 RepID=A0A9X3CED7_9VIBR|nr:TadE/TadG family type IV pilus assembly protein [Vibrio paucivorans]MCW8334177.1 pilus assembly protein TadG-related protein [Vibrio paucivorans]